MSMPRDGQSAQPLMAADVERGKTDSYIAATDPNAKPTQGMLPQTVYHSEKEEVEVLPVVPVQFIGLTKEELEKYRNDPFWRKLRMFLFILFWLAWIAMFVLAIAIVVVSPKCPPRIVPQWWQRKVSYEAWVPSVQDSDGDGLGDVRGLNDRLDSLRRIGVQSVRMAPIAHAESALGGFDVLDAAAVDPKLGTEQDFLDLVENIHWNDMFALVDLPLSVTSAKHEWMQASARGDPAFADFYHWHSGGDADIEYFGSLEGTDKQYMHVKGAANENLAVLNTEHPVVINHTRHIVRTWLERGVDGFYVPYSEYFGRSADEPSTLNWNKLFEAFAFVRSVIDDFQLENPERDDIILFTSFPPEIGLTDSIRRLLVDAGKLNFIINQDMKRYSEVRTMLPELRKSLEFFEENNISYPLWEASDSTISRSATRLGNSRPLGELWNMLLMLLPGAVNVYYGEELVMRDSDQVDAGSGLQVWRSPMQWSEGEHAGFTTGKPYFPPNSDYKEVNFDAQYYNAMTAVKMFRRLAELRRNDDVIMSGEFKLAPNTVDDNLFTFARLPKGEIRRGHKIYACALNFDTVSHSVTFDNSTVPLSAAELNSGSIVTVTSNLGARGDLWPRKTIDWPLSLGAQQGVVIRFVKD